MNIRDVLDDIKIIIHWIRRITKLGRLYYRYVFRKGYEPIGRTSSYMPVDTIIFRKNCATICPPIEIYAIVIDEEEGYELFKYRLVEIEEVDEDVDILNEIDRFTGRLNE